MTALVVYHSLYGNTAALAHAIAEGIGDARAVSTSSVPPSEAGEASMVVAGSPVHMSHLPSPSSMRNAAARPGQVPDLTQTLLREWLTALPRVHGIPAAAFDSRTDMQERGSAPVIGAELARAGFRMVVPPQPFEVTYADGRARLAEGELERARAWGAGLLTAR